jgi:NAD(P)H-hydrate epimerase
MIQRKINSHKGDNGKIMIIGGNARFHGAPILCALGAEYSGVDMIYPFMPPCHAQVARTYSCNFILDTFAETMLTLKDVTRILNLSKDMDAVVIGPGLGTHKNTKAAVKKLLANLKVPTVVDACAIMFSNQLPKDVVFTPHHGEFRELTGQEPNAKNARKLAETLKATIVLKGPQDIIATPDEVAINDTGNALMTVGGSGDVLSGVIGGFIAQGYSCFEAGKLGVRMLGLAGESLGATQASVRAIDLAMAIPVVRTGAE